VARGSAPKTGCVKKPLHLDFIKTKKLVIDRLHLIDKDSDKKLMKALCYVCKKVEHKPLRYFLMKSIESKTNQSMFTDFLLMHLFVNGDTYPDFIHFLLENELMAQAVAFIDSKTDAEDAKKFEIYLRCENTHHQLYIARKAEKNVPLRFVFDAFARLSTSPRHKLHFSFLSVVFVVSTCTSNNI
jgi:hypothetical protein